MFNKLKFNNLVISSKKLIQKGKSQVVQKCVQKIRKLKLLNEKQPENAKHKQSLRKTLALMENLKKIKSHDIIKSMLLLEKKPTAVLTNARSSIEETSTAMLSMNKILQNLIEKIKTELQLNGNNMSWRKVLQEQSKKKLKKAHTEVKKRRRMELKSQKLMTRKRQEWIESNLTNTNDVQENPKEFVKTTNGIWKEEKIEEEEACEPRPKIKFEKPEQIKTLKVVAPQPKVKKIDTPIITKAPIINNTSVPVEVEPKEEQIVDPFFITEKGDTYVATFARGVNTENYEPVENRRNTIVDLQHRQKPERNLYNKTKNFNEKQKMHPSWEARQNKRPVITKFQGTKINFTNETKVVENEKTESIKPDNLHPSWAAKQKLKPVITAFQGKKIVFE